MCPCAHTQSENVHANFLLLFSPFQAYPDWKWKKEAILVKVFDVMQLFYFSSFSIFSREMH